MQQTSAKQYGGHVVSQHLPITSKHSSAQQPRPPPSFCPHFEVTSMPASPCIIPCCAAGRPQLDMSTCISPAHQQQQQLQHVGRQPQQQTGSQGSQHSSLGHAAQISALQQQQHAKHAVNVTHCHNDRGMDDASLPRSLAAQDEQPECTGQASARWAVCSPQAEASRPETGRQQETGSLQQKEMSRQQETCQLQEKHRTSGRDGSAVGEGMMMVQGSSRAAADGLQPCSPSEHCSPDAAAQASRLLTGQPHLSTVLCVVSNAMRSFSAASPDLKWWQEGLQHPVFMVLQMPLQSCHVLHLHCWRLLFVVTGNHQEVYTVGMDNTTQEVWE